MLLDQQYAAHPLPASANGKRDRRSKKSNRTVSEKRASDKVPGFVLRDSLPGQQPSQQSLAQIEQLYSMFGSSLERSTIEHVFLQCKQSVEAAIDELLALSERKQSDATANSSSEEPTQPSGMQQHTALKYAALESAALYHTVSLHAVQVNHETRTCMTRGCFMLCPLSPLMIAGPPAGSSYWSWLPEECKGLVLKHLDSKDLAKAARTSKEFAEHIRAVRAGLGVLNVPPGKFARTDLFSCQHGALGRIRELHFPQ